MILTRDHIISTFVNIFKEPFWQPKQVLRQSMIFSQPLPSGFASNHYVSVLSNHKIENWAQGNIKLQHKEIICFKIFVVFRNIYNIATYHFKTTDDFLLKLTGDLFGLSWLYLKGQLKGNRMKCSKWPQVRLEPWAARTQPLYMGHKLSQLTYCGIPNQVISTRYFVCYSMNWGFI